MSEQDVFTLHRGTRPLLISMPHVGTLIPDDIAARLRPHALAVEDTDWHLEHALRVRARRSAPACSCHASRATAST